MKQPRAFHRHRWASRPGVEPMAVVETGVGSSELPGQMPSFRGGDPGHDWHVAKLEGRLSRRDLLGAGPVCGSPREPTSAASPHAVTTSSVCRTSKGGSVSSRAAAALDGATCPY